MFWTQQSQLFASAHAFDQFCQISKWQQISKRHNFGYRSNKLQAAQSFRPPSKNISRKNTKNIFYRPLKILKN